MRFTTRQIYRAFSELDQFGDEQCARFVAAARGGVVTRWFSYVLLAATGLFGALMPTIAVQLASEFVLRPMGVTLPTGLRGDPLVLALVAVGILVGAFTTLMVRDFDLRRRLIRILRKRGVCRSCGYSLVGLPVDPSSFVTCPECRTRCEVDAAMGHLTITEGHVALKAGHTQPDVEHQPPILSPAAKRTIGRTVGYSVLGLIIILLVVAGSYEGYIRLQASRAAAFVKTNPSPATYTVNAQPQFVATTVPSARGGDFWPLLKDFALKHKLAFDQEIDQLVVNVGRENYHGYLASSLLSTGKRKALQQPFSVPATQILGILETRGVFAAIDTLGTATSADFVMPFEYDFFVLKTATIAANINLARLELACDAGEVAQFSAIVRNNLAIANAIYTLPGWRSFLVGAAIENLTHSAAARALRSPARADFALALSAVYKSSITQGLATSVWSGLQLYEQRRIAKTFSSVEEVRYGAYGLWGGDPIGKMISHQVQGVPLIPLGTFDVNIFALSAVITQGSNLAATPRALRTTPSTLEAPISNLAIFSYTFGRFDSVLDALDSLQLQRERVAALIAIEQFHARTGRYPVTLAELVPTELLSAPLDPWSGLPLRYNLSPTGFLLYAFGVNGVDDGGKFDVSQVPPPFKSYNVGPEIPSSSDIDLAPVEP